MSHRERRRSVIAKIHLSPWAAAPDLRYACGADRLGAKYNTRHAATLSGDSAAVINEQEIDHLGGATSSHQVDSLGPVPELELDLGSEGGESPFCLIRSTKINLSLRLRCSRLSGRATRAELVLQWQFLISPPISDSINRCSTH